MSVKIVINLNVKNVPEHLEVSKLNVKKSLDSNSSIKFKNMQ